MNGDTQRNYTKWTDTTGIQPRSIVIPQNQTHLPDETKAFWVGDPTAEEVILYFHGGGYALPGSAGSFNYLSTIVKAAKDGGKSVAALVLQYDLAPAYQYPHQLQQAVELLRDALTTLQKAPSQITLLGDSAGGHLVLGVLSHLLSPNPKIAKLELSAPLKMAVACSPAVTMNWSHEDKRSLEAFEPSTAQTRQVWRRNVLPVDYKPDNWTNLIDSEQGWWGGLHKVVKDVLITSARKEMMVSDICAFVDKLEADVKAIGTLPLEAGAKAGSGIELFVSETDFHAEPATGLGLGLPEGDTARVIRSWIVNRL